MPTQQTQKSAAPTNALAEDLLSQFPKTASDSEKLAVLAAMLHALQHIDPVRVAPFLPKLVDHPEPTAALQALLLYLEVLRDTPDDATDALMSALLNELTGAVPAEVPATERAFVPALYTERALAKIFTAAAFTPAVADAITALFMVCRPHGAGMPVGPEFQALAFECGQFPADGEPKGAPGQMFVVMETGEIVMLDRATLNIVKTSTTSDCGDICPSLLAYTCMAVRVLRSYRAISPETEQLIENGILGVFQPEALHARDIMYAPAPEEPGNRVYDCVYDRVHDCVYDCVHSYKINTRMISVTATPTDYDTAYTAMLTTSWPPYSVLMRLDKPRLHTSAGVYLFPAEQGNSRCLILLPGDNYVV